MKKSDEAQPIIIKKIKKGGGGHHGGAWKVAYADFVTAMMAFFLLLWLLNVTTEEAKDIISNYFDPTQPKVSQSTSGAGGVMGGLSMTKEGAMAEDAQAMTQSQETGKPSSGEAGQTVTESSSESDQQEQMEAELRSREDAKFEETRQDIEKAIQSSPELKELASHLMIDITPEGLRIQIIDQDGDPMFPSGSAAMYEKTQKLMGKVAELIAKLPNAISVRGHTDASKYASAEGYTNWELSADRANASRRLLSAHGIPEKRLANVMGKADTDPFIQKDPLDARNRRISILLLRETLEEALKRGEFGSIKTPVIIKKAPAPIIKPFQKTQGNIQFP